MNSVIKKILNAITNKKREIFQLSGKNEREITTHLFNLLGWDNNREPYVNNGGFFGQTRFRPDGWPIINSKLVIIEVKKVTEKHEYGYWHALSQGLIYSYQQQRAKQQNFLVLCIIFDWGRAAAEGRELYCYEKQFLDKVRNDNDRIHFLRVSMSKRKIIEHNMNTNWEIIE